MKSIGVTLQPTYLTENCKKSFVQHPARLSNTLVITKYNCFYKNAFLEPDQHFGRAIGFDIALTLT